MTDDELDAIEQRANAATPGPWLVLEQSSDEVWFGDGYYDVGPTKEGFEIGTALVGGEREDAKFIAAARTDVPALVAKVRRLRKQLEGPLYRLAIVDKTTMALRLRLADGRWATVHAPWTISEDVEDT